MTDLDKLAERATQAAELLRHGQIIPAANVVLEELMWQFRRNESKPDVAERLRRMAEGCLQAAAVIEAAEAKP